MYRICLPILLAVTLLLTGTPATAQSPTVRFVVRDATTAPIVGLTVVLDTGDGRGPLPYVTDAQGATARIVSATQTVTVTQVFDTDGVALGFEQTTLDGRLVLPLLSDLEVPWSYDRASRQVISLPQTMINEAFPEREVIPDNPQVALLVEQMAPEQASIPAPDGAPTTADAPAPAPASASVTSVLWVVLGGLLLISLGVGLVLVRRARLERARSANQMRRLPGGRR